MYSLVGWLFQALIGILRTLADAHRVLRVQLFQALIGILRTWSRAKDPHPSNNVSSPYRYSTNISGLARIIVRDDVSSPYRYSTNPG